MIHSVIVMALKPKDFGGPSSSLPAPLRKVLALSDAPALSLDVRQDGQEQDAAGQVAKEDLDRLDTGTSAVMELKQEVMQLDFFDVTAQGEPQAR